MVVVNPNPDRITRARASAFSAPIASSSSLIAVILATIISKLLWLLLLLFGTAVVSACFLLNVAVFSSSSSSLLLSPSCSRIAKSVCSSWSNVARCVSADKTSAKMEWVSEAATSCSTRRISNVDGMPGNFRAARKRNNVDLPRPFAPIRPYRRPWDNVTSALTSKGLAGAEIERPLMTTSRSREEVAVAPASSSLLSPSPRLLPPRTVSTEKEKPSRRCSNAFLAASAATAVVVVLLLLVLLLLSLSSLP